MASRLYSLAMDDSGKVRGSDHISLAVETLETLLMHVDSGQRIAVDVRLEFRVENGVIVAEYAWMKWLAALDGLRVDRFRKCALETCSNYFYAAREESEACSPRHASTLRKRKYRHPPDEKPKKGESK